VVLALDILEDQMDIVALSHAVTSTLAPVLPYLLKMGESATEEAGKKIGVDFLMP
jgi:hypothetical protein